MVKASIIVIKYNQPEYEARTIQSIIDYTKFPYDLIAYQNKKGVGLATAWNKMIEPTDSEYICLLNSDVVVTQGWLTKLISGIDTKKKREIVMPTSNRVGGGLKTEPPFSRYETNFKKINDFAKVHWEAIPENERYQETDKISGFCMLFRREIWEQEPFDERFFLFKEDTEWGHRLKKKHGYKFVWAKGVYIHHYHNVSVQKAVNDRELNREKVESNSIAIMEEIVKEGYK